MSIFSYINNRQLSCSPTEKIYQQHWFLSTKPWGDCHGDKAFNLNQASRNQIKHIVGDFRSWYSSLLHLTPNKRFQLYLCILDVHVPDLIEVPTNESIMKYVKLCENFLLSTICRTHRHTFPNTLIKSWI